MHTRRCPRWSPVTPVVLAALVALPAVADVETGGGEEPVETVGVVEQKCSVLVMNLDGRALEEADAEMPQVLTEALVAEVAAVSGCTVVSEADIASMLELEATKASCGGELDSCLAEIGAAFGAERAVSGTVGRLGEDFLLSARLLNVQEGSVEARAEQTVKGEKERLRVAVKNLGRGLFEKELLREDEAAGATAAPAASAGGLSFSLLSGVALTSVGALLIGGGAIVTGVAEARMSDPTTTDKGEMQLLGLAALGGAGAGVLFGVGGGALLALAMVE